MSKKNLLQTIRDLHKSAIPIYDPEGWWECGVCHGNNEWDFWDEGTLDKCMRSLTNFISFEVDSEIRGLNLEPNEWAKRQSQRRAEIRQQCLTTGRAAREGRWEIHSVLTAEEIRSQQKYLSKYREVDRREVDRHGFAPNPKSKSHKSNRS